MDKDFEEKFYNEVINKCLYDYENDQYKQKILITNDFARCETLEFYAHNLYSYIVSDMYARFLRMSGNNVLYQNLINDLSKNTFKLLNDNNIDFPDIEAKYKNNLDTLSVSYDSRYFFKTNDKKFIKECDNFFERHYNKEIFYDLLESFVTPMKDKVYNIFDLQCENDRFFNEDREEVFKTLANVVYLDFSKCDNQVIEEIENLNIDNKYKTYIFNKLDIYDTLKIHFYIDETKGLDIDVYNPEYLAGCSYICLNPNYINVLDYANEDEVDSVREYINKHDSDFVYSGLLASNPLTGNDIYIFISYFFDEPIHLGIPSIFEEDSIFNNLLGLEYQNIISGDILINSDFLTGLTIKEAHDKIFELFLSENMATINKHLRNNKIILSSFDDSGLPIPLETLRGKKVDVLNKNMYPIYYNKFLKLIYEDIERPIELINLNFNDTYIDALSDLYLSKKELYFKDFSFLDNKIKIIDETSIFNRIVIPLIFKIVDNKPITNDKYFILHQNCNDINFINKMNNLNVNFVTDTLSLNSSDSVRLYILFDLSEELDASLKRISDIDYFINKVIKKYDEEFSYDNYDLSQEVSYLSRELKKFAESLNFKDYYKKIEHFFETKINNKKWSEEDALNFLKLLSILTPITCESIYREKFNGRDYLMYEYFPTYD